MLLAMLRVRLTIVLHIVISLALIACNDASPEAAPTVDTTPAATAARPSPIPSPTALPSPTPIVIANLPIIDLHFHPDPAWGAALPAFFDSIGVRAAGNGASAVSGVALAEAERNAGRI